MALTSPARILAGVSGEILRLIRERRGLSVATLARGSEVGADEIVAFESGHASLDASTARRLLAAMLAAGERSDVAADLDDPGLIARQRAMPIGARLESGFALCRFVSQLAGSARA